MTALKDIELNSLFETARAHYSNGNLAEAAKAYSVIYSMNPANLESAERLGTILAQTGNLETARKIFEKILEQHPNDANTYNNLSNVLIALNKPEEALKCSEKAIALIPGNKNFYLNLARLYTIARKMDKTYETYKKVLELDPQNLRAAQAVTDISITNFPDDSLENIKHLYSLKPNPGLKISIDTFVPTYFQSQEDIDAFRKELLKKIDALDGIKMDAITEDKKIYQNYFYLAYHARNNKELKVKLADLYEKALPSLSYISPHVKNYKRDKGKKIKVGFLSSFFHKHPVSMCFSGLIREMNQDSDFEVHAFYYGQPAKDPITKIDVEIAKLRGADVKFHVIPSEDINEIIKAISAEELDVTIRLDIGMYWISYFLGFARLAPIQGLLAGHPDTSGMKSIDYYFSGHDLEGEGAEEYYSEQLVRVDNIVNYMEYPTLPEIFKTRKELNLPEDKTIYYCPMKNQKIHPDFDYAIKQILEQDEKAVILFPKDEGVVSDLVLKRMEKNIGNLIKRVMFHPWASQVEFLSYIKHADVMLDTFNFGCGTTLYFIFAIDAPIVTLPGMTTGGRVTNAAYKKMGIEDLIAKDKEEYVRLAIKCANDKEFSKSIQKKINANKDILYNNAGCVDEIKDFIRKELDKLV